MCVKNVQEYNITKKENVTFMTSILNKDFVYLVFGIFFDILTQCYLFKVNNYCTGKFITIISRPFSWTF